MSTHESAPARRDFLKAGAAGAVAIPSLTGGVFAAQSQSAVRVGLVGCGGRGSGAIRDILKADAKANPEQRVVEVAAFCDAFPDKAKSAFESLKKDKQFGAQVKATPDAVFGGLDGYKKLIESGVDLVILATPPGFRPMHIEAVIAAGKHLFCEKPVAVDAAGALRVLKAAEEAKKKNLAVVAGTQRRHQKGYIDTIKQIHDGAIGDIITARCAWVGQDIWFKPRQPGQKDADYQVNNWYHFNWLSGDQYCEQHIHNLDVINWVMGGPPVKAVGLGGRAVRDRQIAAVLQKSAHLKDVPVGTPGEYGNIFDHFTVEFEYANGARMYSFSGHIRGAKSDVSETVFGSKGTCRVNAYSIGKKRVAEDTDTSPYVQEHIDLLNSIRAGNPLNELKQVTESTLTAILGREACYTGKELTMEGYLKSGHNTMPKDVAFGQDLPVSPTPIPGTYKFA